MKVETTNLNKYGANDGADAKTIGKSIGAELDAREKKRRAERHRRFSNDATEIGRSLDRMSRNSKYFFFGGGDD